MDCWVQEAVGVVPPTIEVTAHQRATVIARDYAVRVQHRNDFEHDTRPQQLSFEGVTSDESEKALKTVSKNQREAVRRCNALSKCWQ